MTNGLVLLLLVLMLVALLAAIVTLAVLLAKRSWGAAAALFALLAIGFPAAVFLPVLLLWGISQAPRLTPTIPLVPPPGVVERQNLPPDEVLDAEAQESAQTSQAGRQHDFHVNTDLKSIHWRKLALAVFLLCAIASLSCRERTRSATAAFLTGLGVVACLGLLVYTCASAQRIVAVSGPYARLAIEPRRSLAVMSLDGPGADADERSAIPAASTETSDQGSTEKSTTTAARPDWIGQPADLHGQIYRISVASGPYVTRMECRRALDAAMQRAADQYVDEYLQQEGAAEVVRIDPAYLRGKIEVAEYAESVPASVGPMQQIYALLEFDERDRGEIAHRWRAALVTTRLWDCGLAAGLVLLLIGTTFGYLKLDQVSGGLRRNGLRLGAGPVLLMVAAGAVLLRWGIPH